MKKFLLSISSVISDIGCIDITLWSYFVKLGPYKRKYIYHRKNQAWFLMVLSSSRLWNCSVLLSVSYILIAIPVLKNMGRVIWSWSFILPKCFHLLYRASAPWAIIFAKWKLKDTPIKIVCHSYIVSCQCSLLGMSSLAYEDHKDKYTKRTTFHEDS